MSTPNADSVGWSERDGEHRPCRERDEEGRIVAVYCRFDGFDWPCPAFSAAAHIDGSDA